MSKVVHLSNDAHAQAKVFCKARGLKMSDWVGCLILEAISSQTQEAVEPEPVPVLEVPEAPRKKKLPEMDDTVQSADDGTPVYAQPPFWAKPKPEPEEKEIDVSTL